MKKAITTIPIIVKTFSFPLLINKVLKANGEFKKTELVIMHKNICLLESIREIKN